ncbi:hypothetical protein C4D60_Mb06t27280 [Musa balbisiana]|uniref:non-specific serine/threonine protein kinase n=1 Tax=Musa balbisiana TaxID=52838 RepID=A0A4S8ITI6_MUSBA|nr:hypothetical protein C4D60_Mb06t27280 [Musa balbisiana]
MKKRAMGRRCFRSRNMAVFPCSILLSFSLLAVQVGGQFSDGLGFISLDCGYGRDAQAYYVGPLSGITYVSDAPYTDSGETHNISSVYASVTLPQRFLTVRSFPSGARNCYTFKSMTPRLKYLIRASFLYGNYDSKNSSSVQFDLHLGVNFWKAMTVTSRSMRYYTETIMEATTDLISVCLVNTGRGTPFISSLELRPLNRTLYPVVNASLSLILSSRFDMGLIGDYVRFPSDPHDRFWNPFNDTASLTKTSTNLTVENPLDDHFEAPHVVMKTAVVPVNSNKLELSLTTEPRGLDEYYAVLHFSELKPLLQNESRQFFVYLGGTLLNDAKPFIPDYLSSSAVYSTNPTSAPTHYNISLVSTSDSTLPPILNAAEVFSAMQNTIVPSDSRNVDAMVAIKGTYAVKRNWMGDPCMPKAYAWDGLNCTIDAAGVSRITAVNLSHGALTGEISTSFANLSEIQYLDLSYNKLTGSIPAFLAYLPSLKYLDLANNELSGLVPSSLLTKSQNGSLTLRIEGNRNVCFDATSCEAKPKKTASTIIVISCVVPVVLLLMLAVLCILRKQRAKERHMRGSKEYTFQIDNRRFTYTELKKITKNFGRVLGKGGFGTVYYGHLENGIKVAVKMLSHTSSEEFVTEVAQHLSRVHHRNLVSMIGYCIDGEHLALVYEYMSQGTLKEHLREAKISDFGLSKAFEDDDHSHVSTKVVGTPGYLDPEYYVKNQLSEKSDVYSFGVVLLELITGQPPIRIGSEKIHIVEWVYETLAKGTVEDVVDKSLQGEYDVNCAWKIAYVALNCAMQSSTKRPTMTEVVMQLKERLALQSNLDKTQLEGRNTQKLLKEHGEMYQISPFEIECASISDKDVTLPQRFLTVRSFPSGARNCYTFKSMTPRLKYIIRASFFYGNYDSKNSSSVQFDLHLGVNFWKTITVTNRPNEYYTETIMEATTDLISVCLVNTGRGTPFISALVLRPLNRTLYPVVNASLSLILSSRFDMGRIADYVRFPSDPHDRFWNPFEDTTSLTKTSTNLPVENPVDDHFEAPHVVMNTAVVPVNSTKLELSLATEPRSLDEYYAVLHFSELNPLLQNESRQFFVYLGGTLLNDAKPFIPDYLSSSAVYSTNPTSAPTHYNISLVSTSDSTLPPILNAAEVFSAMQNTIVPSDSRNVDAMVAIKGTYAVKRNWMGDPCMPKAYAWDGLNCTVDAAGVSRITAVNLSHGALTGEISTSFANLSEIQYLDLSYNKLTGSIPAFLAYLPSLKYLDLANNELSGLVPSSLLTKSQNGSLTLRIEGNRNVCFNATSCEAKPKKTASTIIVISCVVPVVLLLMLAVLCILRKQRAKDRQMRGSKEYAFQIDNRRFTYTELKKITKNFDRVLGKGGFGTVYYGQLENAIEVAVKMLSHTSSEEFVTEAQHLSRVHHRNLVSMIGYCIDGEHLALVYEYMSQGTLKEHLREAKISDFGLSKAFEDDDHSHIAYVALNCAMQSSTKRPTMTEVVMQLKERLALQSNLDKTQLEGRNTQKLLEEHGEMYQISPFEIECASISDKDGPSAR